MKIWIEPFPLLARIEALQPMLLQRLHQYGFRHLETTMQILEIFITVLLAKFLGGDGRESAVKVIDTVDEVFGEA